MKRAAPSSRSGSKTNDVKRDLSSAQLQAVGAVAIAWNEVEFLLDCMLYSGLHLSAISWLDIVTRIGLDAKIDLIAAAKETSNISDNISAAIQRSIHALKALKDLRHSVIHARVFDASRGIGENIRRGAKISQVLLTEQALNGLYERLAFLRVEMQQVIAIVDLVRTSGFAVRAPKGADAAAAIPEVKRRLELLQEFQAKRLALPGMPAFPT